LEARHDCLGALDKEHHGRGGRKRVEVCDVCQIRHGERRNRERVLAAQPQRGPARDDHLQAAAPREEVPDQWPRCRHLLEVIEDDEYPLLTEERDQRLVCRRASDLAQTERVRDCHGDERRIVDRGERDEEETVREIMQEMGGDFGGEPRLADATRPRDGQQPNILLPEQRGCAADRRHAANERRERHEEIRRRGADGHEAGEEGLLSGRGRMWSLRSRSLIARALRVDRSASASCVSPAAVRKRRSREPNADDREAASDSSLRTRFGAECDRYSGLSDIPSPQYPSRTMPIFLSVYAMQI